jgi:hypothetical protein
MLDRPDFATIAERQYEVVPATDQLVFYGRSRPAGELDEPGLIRSLVEQAPGAAQSGARMQVSSNTGQPLARHLRQSILATYPKWSRVVED